MLRNSVWQLLLTVSATGVELIVLLAFAAALPAAEFGVLAVALSATKIVFLFFEARIHEYFIPKFVRYQHRSRTLAWRFATWSRRIEISLNVTALVTCGLLAFALPSVAGLPAGPIVLSCAIYAFANTFAKFSSLGVFRCTDNVRIAALIALVSGVAKLLLLAMIVLRHWSPVVGLVLLSVPSFLAATFQLRFADAGLRGLLGTPPATAAMKMTGRNRRQHGRLMVANYATGLVEVLFREVDLQLVALLSSATEAGRYRVAKTLGMLVLEALNPIVLVMLPELVRRLRDRQARAMRGFLSRISVLLLAVAGCTGLGVMAVGYVYLTYFAPLQWPAFMPLVIFVAGFCVTAPLLWTQSFHVASGAPQRYLIASIAGACLSVAGALLLARPLGATGAALSHVAGLMATAGISLAAVMARLRAIEGG